MVEGWGGEMAVEFSGREQKNKRGTQCFQLAAAAVREERTEVERGIDKHLFKEMEINRNQSSIHETNEFQTDSRW